MAADSPRRSTRTAIALLCAALLSVLQQTAAAAEAFAWGPYRGFNGRINLQEQDIADLAANGVTLFRATAALFPLMDREPPYAINMDNVARLDRVIDACERHGIKVVINPHTTPGTTVPQTTRANDPLWNDYYWHGHLIRLWAFLAARYRDRGAVIAGYDLLNEPYAPGDIEQTSSTPGPGNWNELLGRLVLAVRHHDPRTPLVIETVAGRRADGIRVNRVDGLRYLQLPDDPYLVLSPHVYAPGSFTHQGLMRFPVGVRYPGVIEGKDWDRAQLAQLLAPLAEFRERTGIPVFIGEFSASLYGGEDADRYVADLVDLFNAQDWSWAYHAWREAPVWDAERPDAGSPADPLPTPRLQALRNGLALRAAALTPAAPATAAKTTATTATTGDVPPLLPGDATTRPPADTPPAQPAPLPPLIVD